MAEDLTKLSDEELQSRIDAARKEQGGGLLAPPPSTWEDIKTIARPSLERGLLSVVGTPGTVADLATRGADAGLNSDVVKNAVGEGPGNAAHSFREMAAPHLAPLTYEGMLKTQEEAEGAPLATAKTTGGQIAQTGLEWAPSIALGAAGAPAKLKAVAQGVGGALGSEGLGQMAQGTPAEPWLRMVGALVGHKVPTMNEPLAKAASAEPSMWTHAKGLAGETLLPAIGAGAALHAGSPVMTGMEAALLGSVYGGSALPHIKGVAGALRQNAPAAMKLMATTPTGARSGNEIFPNAQTP